MLKQEIQWVQILYNHELSAHDIIETVLNALKGLRNTLSEKESFSFNFFPDH